MAKKTALIVGIDRYKHISNLRFAESDARRWKAFLLAIDRDFEIRELYNEKATKEKILEEYGKLVDEPCDSDRSLPVFFSSRFNAGDAAAEITENIAFSPSGTVAGDTLATARAGESVAEFGSFTTESEAFISQAPCICVFVFAGHGCNVQGAGPEEPDGLDEAICPYDTRAVPVGNAAYGVRKTVVTDNELVAKLKSLAANKDYYDIRDSCFSGDPGRNMGNQPVNWGYRGISPFLPRMNRVRRVLDIPRACFMTAARENEPTPDSPSFTGACQRALAVDPTATPAQVIATAQGIMKPYGTTPQLYDGAGLANVPIFRGRRSRRFF